MLIWDRHSSPCTLQNMQVLHWLMSYISYFTEMEKKLLEERALKQKVENRLLEAEKQRSMLDCDLKQSQQKINELLRQKDILNEDVRNTDKRSLVWNLFFSVLVFFLLWLYLGISVNENGRNFSFSVFGAFKKLTLRSVISCFWNISAWLILKFFLLKCKMLWDWHGKTCLFIVC